MYTPLLPALLAAVCVALPLTPALAQVRADPGVVIEGQVGLRVYVTLSDEEVVYFPVVRHRMTLTSAAGDSLPVRTDDAGVIALLVPPGEYRLTSSRPLIWRGTTYRWDIPVIVRADMRLVDLGPRNAIREGRAAAALRSGAPG